ncbi:hypothetical protein BH23PAT1_BH23PAT1_1000 [soil metagenome]
MAQEIPLQLQVTGEAATVGKDGSAVFTGSLSEHSNSTDAHTTELAPPNDNPETPTYVDIDSLQGAAIVAGALLVAGVYIGSNYANRISGFVKNRGNPET